VDSNTENNITIAQTRQNKFKFPLILLIVLGIIFAAYTALTNYFTKKVISQDITEAAIAVNAPYQESPVISGINWDPASSVVRKATIIRSIQPTVTAQVSNQGLPNFP